MTIVETNRTPARPALFLLVRPATRHYLVRRDDLTDMRRIAGPADLDALGTPDRPAVPVKLSALLGEPAPERANQALIVSLRRRPVVFLVQHVEMLIEHAHVEPLPALLRAALGDAWSVGTLLIDEEPTIVLDLRAIARSVLAAAKTTREE